VRDVFAGNTTPVALTTTAFTWHVRRVLETRRDLCGQLRHTRDLVLARREAATIGSVFPHAMIIADPAMLKGRRYGNIVIAGSDVPIGDDPALVRTVLGGGVPAHVWDDRPVRTFVGAARVLRGADSGS
jgi:spermidine synthase